MVHRARLSLLMFLQYFSLGTVFPLLTRYLKGELGLSPSEVGWVVTVGSLASVGALLVGARLADRLISSRALFAWLNLGAAVFFAALAWAHDFTGALLFYTLAMLAKGPTFALSNSLTFQNIDDRERHFPGIRLWGSLGWIAAGWLFSLFLLSEQSAGQLVSSLYVAAGASAALSLYTLTLPKGRLYAEPETTPAGRPAKLKFDREMIVFLVVTVLVSAIDKFYFFGASIHLSQLGLADRWILPVMTLGQVTEVAAMALMAGLLPKLGFRLIFILGVLWQVVRFALLAWAQVPVQAMLGIGFHGLAFAFFFANAFVYIDSKTLPENRAKIHQLYMVLLEGVGVVTGNGVAGQVAQLLVDAGGKIDFTLFWLVPGVTGVVALGLLAVFFRPAAAKV